MSRLKRERARKKLPALLCRMQTGLSRVDREGLAQLVWAVWGLQQSEPNEIAQQIISFPAEAITDDMSSRWAIYPWELETLMNLATQVHQDRRIKPLGCSRFEIAGELVNLLRNLENVESETYLDDLNIFNEVHRIGQRQFPFQRGFFNSADFYRSVFLYGQGPCAEAFESAHSISVADFMKVGFALFSQFNRQPVVGCLPDYSSIGISPETTERAINMMCIDENVAGTELQTLVTQLGASHQPIAYRPSLLRRHPLLRFGGRKGRLRAPLPSLIALRISGGLYYDVLPGGRTVRDEVAKRFERYANQLLAATMPELHVEPEYRYRRAGAGNQVDTPDVLASHEGRLTLVVECKATKLTFGAQYSGDPALQAADKYEELAKGVFQLWRFFSHCRLGLTRNTVGDDTFAVLLTVDAWLTMSRGLQEHVFTRARAKADAEGGITEEDRRPIAFAAVQDFERLLLSTDLSGLKQTLSAANEERFLGWLLPDVGRNLDGRAVLHRRYPFDLGDILPWWGRLTREAQFAPGQSRAPATR